MKHDPVDKLIQHAYLEGAITTRKAYEDAVAKRNIAVVLSEEKRIALERRLEQALARSHQEKVPATVGAFLQKVKAEQSIKAQEIFARVGLAPNVYRMLEHDRISPLKISAEAWKKIRTLFNLQTDELVAMVRRTHQLVFFRPSFRTTLARYDAKKNKGMKASTLEKAASELYSKARLDLPEDEKEKLEKLLKSIAAGK